MLLWTESTSHSASESSSQKVLDAGCFASCPPLRWFSRLMQRSMDYSADNDKIPANFHRIRIGFYLIIICTLLKMTGSSMAFPLCSVVMLGWSGAHARVSKHL